MDAAQRGKRDGILQAADQPRGRARQSGGNLTDPSPIIVTARLAAADQGWAEGLRRQHFPAERNLVPAHITLFHQLPAHVERELARRVAHIVVGPAPVAWISGIMDLGGGTAMRIQSPELEAVRDDLAQSFSTLLIPQDRAGWRPHLTIQNKVDRPAATALQRQLAGTDFPKQTSIAALDLWFYRGGPWQAIRSYTFRG